MTRKGRTNPRLLIIEGSPSNAVSPLTYGTLCCSLQPEFNSAGGFFGSGMEFARAGDIKTPQKWKKTRNLGL